MIVTMRYLIWNLILVLGLAALSSCEQDRSLLNEIAETGVAIQPENLPASVQTYISTTYPNREIDEAERYDACGLYEVELDNGLELYFDLQGNFLGTEETYECEDDDDYVSPSSLPASVLSYLAANYPTDSIYEVELEEECEIEVYEVELSSGLELYFDLQGSFLGIEDTYDCDDDSVSLPANALSYLSANYPNDAVYEAELKDECEVYEVELDSGLELYFDLQGTFLGTEDTYDCEDGD